MCSVKITDRGWVFNEKANTLSALNSVLKTALLMYESSPNASSTICTEMGEGHLEFLIWNLQKKSPLWWQIKTKIIKNAQLKNTELQRFERESMRNIPSI